MLPVFYFAPRKDLKELCEKHDGEQKLTPEMFIPTKSDPEATGYDVRCAKPGGVILKPDCYLTIPLGFRAFCPNGWWLRLNPRSSMFAKNHLHALYGVIDETFENEFLFACQYIPDACTLLNSNAPKSIAFGERIGQLIPIKREEMLPKTISNEEIDNMFNSRKSTRGTGGFGSSGKI